MDKSELVQKLEEAGVPGSSYAFDSGDECLVLANENQKWQLFYSERGERKGLAEFPTEEEACQGMFNLLMRDHGYGHLRKIGARPRSLSRLDKNGPLGSVTWTSANRKPPGLR